MKINVTVLILLIITKIILNRDLEEKVQIDDINKIKNNSYNNISAPNEDFVANLYHKLKQNRFYKDSNEREQKLKQEIRLTEFGMQLDIRNGERLKSYNEDTYNQFLTMLKNYGLSTESVWDAYHLSWYNNNIDNLIEAWEIQPQEVKNIVENYRNRSWKIFASKYNVKDENLFEEIKNIKVQEHLGQYEWN